MADFPDKPVETAFDPPKTLRGYYPSKSGIEVVARRLIVGEVVDRRMMVLVERTVKQRGQYEMLALDPRAVVSDGGGRILYSGRDWMAHPAFDVVLREWLVQYPSWPPRVLPPWPPDNLLGSFVP